MRRSIPILLLDTLRPFYLGVVVFFVMWKWLDLQWPAPDDSSGDSLLGAALTVSSVVIGFLVSAKAIIIAGSSRPIEQIKQMGLQAELSDAFRLAIYISLAFTMICTIGFFWRIERVYEAAWTATGVAMVYSFLRIAHLLFRIVGGIK